VEGAGVTLAAAGLSVLAAESLAEGMRLLRELEGVQSVLVEGGGRLGAALLAADLVDRVYLVQAPLWLGRGGIQAFPDLPDVSLGAAARWEVVERRGLGQDTLLVVDRAACSPVS
jgi:diaminohydroxyphosphoribosylaminopyrimidine deaminase/5-amino-6-(5-phosphoribosylamino)uracil reductase